MAAVSSGNCVVFLTVYGVLLTRGDKGRAVITEEARAHLDAHRDYIERNSNSRSEIEGAIVNTHFFSRRAVSSLENLIDRIQGQADLVLCGGWKRKRAVGDLRVVDFKHYSFKDRITDRTSDEHYGPKEISSWLQAHPEVTNYVVLHRDNIDGQHCLEDLTLQRRTILIDTNKALQPKDVECALEILQPSNPQC